MSVIVELVKANIILIISLTAYIVTFLIRLSYMRLPKIFKYNYVANTIYRNEDHYYSFLIQYSDGGYKCYIENIPSFRGRDTSQYTAHYWTEKISGRNWICWTGKIKHPEQAKTLCRNWSDATQQFIDTGIPAPGFERQE